MPTLNTPTWKDPATGIPEKWDACIDETIQCLVEAEKLAEGDIKKCLTLLAQSIHGFRKDIDNLRYAASAVYFISSGYRLADPSTQRHKDIAWLLTRAHILLSL